MAGCERRGVVKGYEEMRGALLGILCRQYLGVVVGFGRRLEAEGPGEEVEEEYEEEQEC